MKGGVKMKRILCYLLLISILLFAFVGCDTHEDPQPTPEGGGNQTGDTNPPADKNEYENNFEDETDLPVEDPYVNVNKTTFYASYTPAKNYKDAEYRCTTQEWQYLLAQLCHVLCG